MARRAAALLALAAVAVCLSGCTLDQVAAEQEKATGLWDELVAGRSYGQTFVCRRDNLARIDLSTATYARANTAPVVFHLRSSLQATEDLVTIRLPAAEIENERPTSIEFYPLAGSRGRSYYFYVESPEAVPGDAITVYAHAADRYAEGTAVRDGQAAEGDLVFTAYSRNRFTPGSVLREFASRAGQEGLFLAGWAAAVLACGAGLAVGLRRGGRCR